jgi:multiple sugar transport system permease protein
MTTSTPDIELAAVGTADQRAPRRRGGIEGGRGGRFARIVIAVVVSAIVIFPLYWMIVVAFSPRGEVFEPEVRFWPSTWTLANFEKIFTLYPLADWFMNSVVIGVLVTVFTVVVNLLAGYAFAKIRFPGSNVLFLLALATMMIPIQAIMVAQFKLVTGLELYGTFWAVILPGAAAAFGIFLARQFFLSVPDELLEAARLDGAGHIRIFLRVVLPLCRPLIAVLTLLTLMGSWNDFAWPLIALKDNALFTLPIGLLYLKGQTAPDYSAIMAMALISVIPMVILFIAFQRYFVQGFARTGIR